MHSKTPVNTIYGNLKKSFVYRDKKLQNVVDNWLKHFLNLQSHLLVLPVSILNMYQKWQNWGMKNWNATNISWISTMCEVKRQYGVVERAFFWNLMNL